MEIQLIIILNILLDIFVLLLFFQNIVFYK